MTPKILLVDDEKAISNLIKLHFQTEGFLVYTASDAEEAVKCSGLDSVGHQYAGG